MINFDVVVEEIGKNGKIQIIIFIILCYSKVFEGIHAMATVFIAYIPDFT